MKNKKAFTLIELVSVLVILAILALIVTPLVLNIVRKARIAADKRSIDAYGRSIELAIADYLLDNGTFPTIIEELTIEYSGDRVECETAGLQPDDTSIYLANCKVNGRDVTGYTYGKVGASSETYKAYNIGDEVTYNNVDYYVIKDSDETESSVILLKAEPLTYEEIQTYSAGTGAQISQQGDYGVMQYHSSSSDYSISYIKTVVDGWAIDKVQGGYEEARLITFDELKNNLGYVYYEEGTSIGYKNTVDTPNWVYGTDYWTMSQYEDNLSTVRRVDSGGNLSINGVISSIAVRPVIVLSKSVLN